jgi:nucleotidyltransferase-like protein
VASPSASAVILYGSRARGDHRPDSDTDVLQILREAQPSRSVEEIVLSCYTLPQLQKMARHGSLFVAHLVAEAIPLRDPENLLGQIRASYLPAPFAHFVTEVSWAARLLTDSPGRFAERPLNYQRLAIHLARTFVYAAAQSHGVTTFSMHEIWKHFESDWGKPLPRPEHMDWQRYLDVRAWLQERLHRDVTNEFETHEALIVSAWGVSRLCVALGLRLLHEGDVFPAYEDTELWGETW